MTVHFETLDKSNAVELAVTGAEVGASGGMYKSAGKRLLDVALVLVFAPLWFPLVLFVTVLLIACGQSPFYIQPRLGQNGRVFRMIKFRTMVSDAERALYDYLARNGEARSEWEAHQKLKSDPRITWIGRFLRKSSLDELPQLLNVLSGDMSLVGPRPMMVEQRAMYPGSDYFLMRPGITGPWQVSDRNSSEFRDRAAHDARYASEISLKRDILILLGTVFVVIRGTGY